MHGFTAELSHTYSLRSQPGRLLIHADGKLDPEWERRHDAFQPGVIGGAFHVLE